MPDIDQNIFEVYRDDGVLVYAIYQSEDPDLMADFIEQTGITMPVVEDQFTLYEFRFPNGVGFPYPKDVIIDKDLTIRSVRNSFDAAEVDTLVQELLAE